MDYSNQERILIRIIKELANEFGLSIELLCYDWVIRIGKDQFAKHIIGYDWEINTSTAQMIAKDKNATYEVLKSRNIPAVEHQLFLRPSFQNYIGTNGNWQDMLDYAEKHDFQIVCKANTGTGGNDVFKITNRLELETCVQNLFVTHRSIALCPFHDIRNEYRVVILNGVVQLIYAKQKPHIVGNGQDTILELIQRTFGSVPAHLSQIDLFRILPENDILELEWKHNLATGATPVLVEDAPLKETLGHIAIQAAQAINIAFASVDIIECDGELRVMEINSGVMMENFARTSTDFYRLTETVYRNALIEMFALPIR